MASPSSCDDVASSIDDPITPQLAQDDSLHHLPLTSLDNSQEDITESHATPSLGDIVNQRLFSDHILSSMNTPPPSSQLSNIRQSFANQGNTPSIIGSSPTTDSNEIEAASISGITRPPTAQEIVEASAEEKVEMIQKLIANNGKLDSAVRESRMEKAHYKLQNTLLTLEYEEAIKHLEAEHELTRREVQILQLANQGRADLNAPSIEYVSRLKAICKNLETENTTIKRRLEKAKKIIETKDDQLEAARETNDRLTQRIRENREHINTMRSPGGMLHISTPKISHHSHPATPQEYRRTQHQTPITGRSTREFREQDQGPGLAALLAAAHHENSSAPTTPLISLINRHSRGAHSLSSLSATPPSARPSTANSTLLPSAHLIQHSASRSSHNNRTPNIPSQRRRRKSRDSTISAEDADEYNRAMFEENKRRENEQIQESQAARSAKEMLRANPRGSFEVAASRTSTPNPVTAKSELLQSKLWGALAKPVIDKRKREDDHHADHSNKKARSSDPIGLGIGYEASRY